MSPYINRPPCKTITCFARNYLTLGEWGKPGKYSGTLTSDRIIVPGGQNHRVADGRSGCEDNSRCRHLKASHMTQKGWPRASGETIRTTGYFQRLHVFQIGARIATQKRRRPSALLKQVPQLLRTPRKKLYFHNVRQQAAPLMPAMGGGGYLLSPQGPRGPRRPATVPPDQPKAQHEPRWSSVGTPPGTPWTGRVLLASEPVSLRGSVRQDKKDAEGSKR